MPYASGIIRSLTALAWTTASPRIATQRSAFSVLMAVTRMDIELYSSEERGDAEEHMVEAIRILNNEIRKAHKRGHAVNATILKSLTGAGAVPQISLSGKVRPAGSNLI